MNRIGIARVLRNAFGVLFKNFGIVLVIAVVFGGVNWALADLVSKAALEFFNPAKGQPSLLVSEGTKTLWLLLWGCIVGSWAAPATLYLWVQHEKKRPTSLYDAVNFGINRYRRVVGAHARAFFIVTIGMIVVVPGILFGLQYAFVDAIATLDAEEKNPLARSRKLTSGRRGTLFRTFAVFSLWWVPFQFAAVFWLQDVGTWALALAGVFDALVLITIDLCMVQFYLDLFRKPAVVAGSSDQQPPVTQTV